MTEGSPPIEVFCSYAHKDEVWLRKIIHHLRLVERERLLLVWHDRLLKGGMDWAQEIDDHLNHSRLILLLISPDFVASDYCYGIEMRRALERHEANEARVIPILVRPVGNWQIAPFARLQALPSGKFLVEWNEREEDIPLAQIANGIYDTLEDMPTQPISKPYYNRPVIWNVPYPRNPFFIGREELLSRLHQQLKAGQATALSQSPQAISGLGGIGKTQIALEYAYRYQRDYQAVLWAQAETQEALTSSYFSIAALLNLPEKDVPESDRVVAAVMDWLRTHKGWLFVMDNADELAQTRAFLPPSFEGHMLLTTRAQAMGRFARCLEVDILPVEQGTLFLLRRAGLLTFDANIEQASDDDRDQARRIYEELGGLPLALDQAGAYIEETGCSLVEYQRLFQSRHADLLAERRGLIDDHPLPVASTWSLSFEQIEQKNPAAADLLRFCAFLAPDAIPETIVIKGASKLGPQLAPVCADTYLLNRAIETLRAYSLLHREFINNSVPLLSVHRLVQAVLKDGMDVATKRLWAGRTVDALGTSLPEVEYSSWEYYEGCLPHIQSCLQLIAQWQLASKEATQLLYYTGIYLVARNRYTEAETFYLQALQIWEQTLDLEHSQVAYPLWGLAYLSFRQGQYAQAEPLYLRALRICKQTLGTKHLQVAQVLYDLATLYLEQGQYVQAESLYLQALQIREDMRGPEHPDVAYSLDGLANAHRLQGHYAQAETLYLRAVHIREHAQNPAHPDFAHTFNGLANLYRNQSRYAEAEDFYWRALRIWEQTVGLEHSQAGYFYGNLARLYFQQGRYDQAEPLFLHSLHIWEQSVGPEHPSMVYYLFELANLYREQRHYAQAEPLYLRALHIGEQTLGTENLRTQEVANTYADFLQRKKHDDEARKLREES
jgi:tetratricopeptide (TPR) repeat protein